MKTAKVTYSDGHEEITGFSSNIKDFRSYLLGQWINFGDTQEHPKDLMLKVTKIEELKNESA